MRPPSSVPAETGFAERHGPTVLLFSGVGLIFAGLIAAFTHQVTAYGMLTTGVLAIVVAAVVSRMEGPFKILFFSGSLARKVRRQ